MKLEILFCRKPRTFNDAETNLPAQRHRSIFDGRFSRSCPNMCPATNERLGSLQLSSEPDEVSADSSKKFFFADSIP